MTTVIILFNNVLSHYALKFDHLFYTINLYSYEAVTGLFHVVKSRTFLRHFVLICAIVYTGACWSLQLLATCKTLFIILSF